MDKSTIHEQSILHEQMIREYQIALEGFISYRFSPFFLSLIMVIGMDIIRKRLQYCINKAGVNQFENCRDLREKYFALCTDRFHGMIFPPGCEPLNREVPGLVKRTS
jgi:hypothetical protein